MFLLLFDVTLAACGNCLLAGVDEALVVFGKIASSGRSRRVDDDSIWLNVYFRFRLFGFASLLAHSSVPIASPFCNGLGISVGARILHLYHLDYVIM